MRRLLLTALLISPACRNKDVVPETGDGTVVETGPIDEDGDGYAASEDCDDSSAEVNPDAVELCDGVDNDCDGEIDEDDAADASTWYADNDGDGYGDEATATTSCEAPSGAAAEAGDCDDSDAAYYPGAPEEDCADPNDYNCDGSVGYADEDGDGWAACEECDDADAEINPDAIEVCNEGVDDDCDGLADDEDDSLDASTGETFYGDSDGDGFGDSDAAVQACVQPEGAVSDSSDCDDSSAEVNPDATEVCNSVDDDCDGTVDEDDAADASTWYADSDGDSYGDASTTEVSCDQPSGYVSDDTDCDDSDASLDQSDGDGDGETSCDGDCDDGAAAVNSSATETCNSVDDDCDGEVDEDDAADASTWYADSDGDSYGDASTTEVSCDQPSGYVSDDTDCDDGSADVNPGETELCNSVDDDCDGTVDEDDAADASTWYADSDGDSYGDASTTEVSCDQPSGYLSDDTDCDDSDATVYPGAEEIWDGVDNDCDGDTDDLIGGSGGDGAISVSGTTDLSTDASGSRSDADAIAWPVTAISGSTVTVDSTVSGLAAGDEVLLINLQGSDTAYAAVGTYELGTVSSVSGADVTLSQAVAETYGEVSNSDLTDQAIVLQRVPNYTDVDVDATGVLTTSAWDGSAGGVLAFRASGTVTVASGGAILVDGLGYAGGATGSAYNCDSYQGESYLGLGSGEYGGTCSAYNEATGEWAPNGGGGGAHICGAGGEYSGGATDAVSWNGGSATPAEAGDTYGAAELTTLFFGSGGGGVWYGTTSCTGSGPGPGGDGAGILWIAADTIEAADSAAITAIGGSSDHCAQGTWTYGAGGAAGGSVHLIADTVDLASDAVDARGGDGNSSNTRVGGDGGDGRVRIDCNTCNGYAQGSSDADTQLADAAEPDPGYNAAP